MDFKCFWLSQSDTGSVGEFYLVTDPGSSGSPPRRPPPTVPTAVPPVAVSTPPVFPPSPIVSNVSRSESFDSTQEKELTVDDIEDFEDDDDVAVVEGFRAKRTLNDASDLAVKLPSFSTGRKLICWISSFILSSSQLLIRLNIIR